MCLVQELRIMFRTSVKQRTRSSRKELERLGLLVYYMTIKKQVSQWIHHGRLSRTPASRTWKEIAVTDTWAGAHLVSGGNLVRRLHVVFIGATCCRVDPCLYGENSTQHPHPARIWSPAQRLPSRLDLTHLQHIYLFFFPPRLLFFSVQWLTWLTLGCCNVKQHAVML